MRVIYDRLFLVSQLGKARPFAVFEQRFDFCNSAHCDCRFFLHFFSHAGRLFGAFGTFFQRSEIGKRQFNIDGFNIGGGIDFIGNMNNIGIVKTADNMGDNAYFTDMRKKLIAESFPLRSALDESCNIDKLDCCRNSPCRFKKMRKPEEPLVR